MSLRADEFKGKELGNIVWAFAVLDFRDQVTEGRTRRGGGVGRYKVAGFFGGGVIWLQTARVTSSNHTPVSHALFTLAARNHKPSYGNSYALYTIRHCHGALSKPCLLWWKIKSQLVVFYRLAQPILQEMLEAVAEVLSPEPLHWRGRVSWEWKQRKKKNKFRR